MAFEKNLEKAKEKAKKVKLFAHDVHGVLTPDTFLCDIEGKRKYSFWHMDGFGDLSLTANGIQIAFLDTTSIDEEGLVRARELKLDKFYYKVTDKVTKLEELKKELGIDSENIGYIGCEVTDIAVMKKVGFAVATADAIDEVKRDSGLHYHSTWWQRSHSRGLRIHLKGNGEMGGMGRKSNKDGIQVKI